MLRIGCLPTWTVRFSFREQAAVESHLAQCQHCQWNLDTLQQTVLWTTELTPVAIPRVFTVPVPAERARAPFWRWSVPLLQGVTAVVALLFFFVVAGDFMLTAVQPRMQPALAPAVTVALERAVADIQTEQLEEIVVESVPEAEEPASAESLAASTESFPTPEPAPTLQVDAAAAEPALGAAEMEMAAPESEQAAGEAMRVEKSAAEPQPSGLAGQADEEAAPAASTVAPPPSAATGTLETDAAWASPEPSALPALPSPTAVPAEVAEVREQPPSAVAEEGSALQVPQGEPRFSWLGAAEVALGAALVLLVAITIIAMVQRRRAR